MEAVDFSDAASRPVTAYGSTGAHWSAIAQSSGEAHVGRMRLEPGGLLGMHPTTVDQLFLVVAGEGWTRRDGRERIQLGPGHGVLWRAGERHESGTDTGMTAMVVQARELQTGAQQSARA
jgi:quercetin dioxygenase-like cupin family protein